MKENLKFWGGKRRFPPLGTHEPNKPEMCYKGEPLAQHETIFQEGFTPELELELLKPYIEYLKEKSERT